MIKCLLNVRHTLRVEAIAVSKRHKNYFSQGEHILIGGGKSQMNERGKISNVFHEKEA